MRIEQFVFPVLRAAAQRDWAMSALSRVLKPWNPFSPERYVDPYGLYERAREAGPVFYQRSLRTWFVTGYAETEEVLRSPSTSVDRQDLMEVIRPYRSLSPQTVQLFTSTILMTDPPDHTRLRRLVNRAFTPRAVEQLEPSVEKICRQLLHDLEGQTSVDAMSRFADLLPIFVISDMLGLPRDQWDQFKAISDEVVKFIDPITGFDPAAMETAVTDFRRLLDPLIALREHERRDDMLGRLVAAEEGGDRLSRDELVSMVALLMVAGHETTSGLIGNSLIALHRFPEQRARLANEPALAVSAVEELLRYDSPVQATDRLVTAPFSVGGGEFKAGQTVAVLLGAANRDPRRYDQPDKLVLHRPDARPLSFGHGIHHCLGAALARLEARVALPLFVQAHPDYSLDEAAIGWKRSVTLRGPTSVPLTNM